MTPEAAYRQMSATDCLEARQRVAGRWKSSRDAAEKRNGPHTAWADFVAFSTSKNCNTGSDSVLGLRPETESLRWIRDIADRLWNSGC